MIYLDEPEITAADRKSVYCELQHYPFSTKSGTVMIFERIMEGFLGVQNCVAVNSGTSALHLSLLASGIRPRDKVIMPVLTFVATANAVKICGAKPVFCDVNADTWCVTKFPHTDREETYWDAFLPVDLYGNPSNPKFIADWKGISPTISDSAEALGSIGNSQVDYACFSFNGNKILTTGSGGLIVGKKLDLVRVEADIGQIDGKVVTAGYNYRMSGMQAALGIPQALRLPETVEKKRRINEIYRNELPMLKFQEATEGTNPNWWMTAALFPSNINIVELQAKLLQNEIPTRRIFKPLNQEPFYQDGKSYPNAEYIYDHGLCLPSSVKNSEKDIISVCEMVKEVV